MSRNQAKDDTATTKKKQSGKSGVQDGKRKTGYQINLVAPRIDLKEVADVDNTNIKDRMLNLEKQFNRIPQDQYDIKASSLVDKDGDHENGNGDQ